MGIKPLDNTPTTTTMLYAKLLSLAITPALFSAEHMEFAGNGCCRFDDWTGHWYSPPGGVGVTAAECKQACLNSNSCVASDMNSRNECFHFRGPIANFRLGCEADNMCWLKKETLNANPFQWIGFRKAVPVENWVQMSFWIKFFDFIPARSSNFGIKLHNQLDNRWVDELTPDRWFYV